MPTYQAVHFWIKNPKLPLKTADKLVQMQYKNLPNTCQRSDAIIS